MLGIAAMVTCHVTKFMPWLLVRLPWLLVLLGFVEIVDCRIVRFIVVTCHIARFSSSSKLCF